jgi:hypothetical protein
MDGRPDFFFFTGPSTFSRSAQRRWTSALARLHLRTGLLKLKLAEFPVFVASIAHGAHDTAAIR